MTQETVTLVIGLAGIVSTLAVSGIGFYYTSKARKTGLRDKLFEKQLDIIVRLNHKQSRIRVFSDILFSGEAEYRDRAREDIGNCIMEYSELEEQASVLLPVELWVEIKHLSEFFVDMLIKFDQSDVLPKSTREDMIALSTKVALLSRVTLGIDELTEESIKLFSSPKYFAEMANLELDYFKQRYSIVNQRHA